MPKISVKIDDDTHHQAKIAAASHLPSLSLSAWVAALLRKEIEKVKPNVERSPRGRRPSRADA